MSVLVEALTVLVRRVTIDAHWPGGTAAYLAAALLPDSRALLACADDELTAVSFASPEDSDVLLDRLDDRGLVYIDNRRCVDVVCVDQVSGPLALCDWVEWRQHPDGFAYAWLAGTDAGDVVAPATRRRDVARRRHAAGADDTEHMIQLASEDGVDYWLDLDTGEQIVALSSQPAADASEPPPPPVVPDRTPLMPIILAAMDCVEWKPEHLGDTTVFIRVRGNRFLFTLGVCIDDDARTIACYGILPVQVEAERRSRVAEAIVRINQGLRIGSFDLDFDDGELRFRAGCDVEGGVLTEHMALAMFGTVSGSIDRFGPALMPVVFGQMSPEDAARNALGSGPPAED